VTTRMTNVKMNPVMTSVDETMYSTLAGIVLNSLVSSLQLPVFNVATTY
jgi:hypothetical protein